MGLNSRIHGFYANFSLKGEYPLFSRQFKFSLGMVALVLPAEKGKVCVNITEAEVLSLVSSDLLPSLLPGTFRERTKEFASIL